jgi:hypothetical protein
MFSINKPRLNKQQNGGRYLNHVIEIDIRHVRADAMVGETTFGHLALHFDDSRKH